MKDSLLNTSHTKTKVAILGFGESRHRAPFDEPDWEIWGMNALYDHIPRYDRWFELHKRQVNLNDEGPEHIWKLAAMDCPIYMQKHYEDIPNSVAYPLEAILQRFRPYLTSSFSFMVALAIMEGHFQEIGVYGVDSADEEWGSQCPSLEYLLGYAEGQGIKVTVPAESSLLKAPFLYGFQEREDQQFFGKLLNMEREYTGKMQDADVLQKRHARKSEFYAGAISVLKELRKEWRLPFNFGEWGDDEEMVQIEGKE